MSQTAIKVNNVGKAYRIGLKEEIPDTLVGAATSWLKAPLRNFQRLRKLNTFSANGDGEEDIIWALRDVSFEVAEGEVLGVIGRNGAGKSTLLKILSRITEPTCGQAIIHGRVSSLLEVGTGFHQELTGRENIYMNGTILGMHKKEIDRKLDEIIAFSGVEKFLDTPIKRYSSGMNVRLAFSVAAHLEPEILIIDEVLAVGDVEFQKKCLGKMEDVASGGRTVLFVSHNMVAVKSLCTRALLLEGGQIALTGSTDSVVGNYLRHGRQLTANEFVGDTVERAGTGEIALSRLALSGSEGESESQFLLGEPIGITMDYEATTAVPDVIFSVTVCSADGLKLLRAESQDSTSEPARVWPGRHTVTIVLDVVLLPGQYTLDVAAFRSNGGTIESIENILTFEVLRTATCGHAHYRWTRVHGYVRPKSTWTFARCNDQQNENA